MASTSNAFPATIYYANGSIVIKSFNTHSEARRFAQFSKGIVKIAKIIDNKEIIIFPFEWV
jgi:hypothetical protein